MTENAKLDPLIQELINRLPEPGAKWPKRDRNIWLLEMSGIFRSVYKDTSD